MIVQFRKKWIHGKDPRKQEAPKCEPKLAEANQKPFFGGLFIVEANNKLTTYATTKIVTK
jgi:hypothetical protein